jgi:hypothetical protein
MNNIDFFRSSIYYNQILNLAKEIDIDLTWVNKGRTFKHITIYLTEQPRNFRLGNIIKTIDKRLFEYTKV